MGTTASPCMAAGRLRALPYASPERIATAAKTIVSDNVDFMVAGGLDSISLVQNEHRNRYRTPDPVLKRDKPELYMPMIDTAEIVAKRDNISIEQAAQWLKSQMPQDEMAKKADFIIVNNGKSDLSTAIMSLLEAVSTLGNKNK